jgi:hypothetical protein
MEHWKVWNFIKNLLPNSLYDRKRNSDTLRLLLCARAPRHSFVVPLRALMAGNPSRFSLRS